jgi:hypothetical protein
MSLVAERTPKHSLIEYLHVNCYSYISSKTSQHLLLLKFYPPPAVLTVLVSKARQLSLSYKLVFKHSIVSSGNCLSICLWFRAVPLPTNA